MIKVVFLDIDNTLLDFDACVRETLKSGFADFGLGSYSETVYETFTRINNRFWKELEVGKIVLEDIRRDRFNTIFEALGVKGDGPAFETYFRERLDASAIPVEGAESFLRTLSGKYRLCAASNGPLNQQMDRMNKAGMTGFFEQLFISGAIGAPKPSEAFFAHCFRALPGVAPEEMMMVGDALSSDIGAARFGLKTCWLNRYGLPMDGEYKPDCEVKSLSEILERNIL